MVCFIISTIQEGIMSGIFVSPREQFGPLNPVPRQSHSLLTILFTHFPPLWHFPPKLGSLHASRHPGMVCSLFNKRARRNFLLPVANLGVFIQPSNLREKKSCWSLSNWLFLFVLYPPNLLIIYPVYLCMFRHVPGCGSLCQRLLLCTVLFRVSDEDNDEDV